MDNISSRKVFHPPHLNNNYRVYLRNDIDKTQYKKRLIKLYAGLNDADASLKFWFEKINNKFQFAPIGHALQQWTSKLEINQNLSGIYYAMAIIKEFNKNEIDVLRILEAEEPQLINNFIDLQEELLTVTRINLCVPYDYIPSYFQKLCSELFVDPIIRNAVERVELLLTPPADPNIKYPTVIIYLDTKIIGDYKDFLYILEQYNLFFTQHPQKTQIDNNFADPWTSFTNVTQGFKLHKVYLNSLNAIGRVYSKESNFAYRIKAYLDHGQFGAQPIKNILHRIEDQLRS